MGTPLPRQGGRGPGKGPPRKAVLTPGARHGRSGVRSSWSRGKKAGSRSCRDTISCPRRQKLSAAGHVCRGSSGAGPGDARVAECGGAGEVLRRVQASPTPPPSGAPCPPDVHAHHPPHTGCCGERGTCVSLPHLSAHSLGSPEEGFREREGESLYGAAGRGRRRGGGGDRVRRSSVAGVVRFRSAVDGRKLPKTPLWLRAAVGGRGGWRGDGSLAKGLARDRLIVPVLRGEERRGEAAAAGASAAARASGERARPASASPSSAEELRRRGTTPAAGRAECCLLSGVSGIRVRRCLLSGRSRRVLGRQAEERAGRSLAPRSLKSGRQGPLRAGAGRAAQARWSRAGRALGRALAPPRVPGAALVRARELPRASAHPERGRGQRRVRRVAANAAEARMPSPSVLGLRAGVLASIVRGDARRGEARREASNAREYVRSPPPCSRWHRGE